MRYAQEKSCVWEQLKKGESWVMCVVKIAPVCLFFEFHIIELQFTTNHVGTVTACWTANFLPKPINPWKFTYLLFTPRWKKKPTNNWVWICLYLPNKISVFDSIFMYLNLQIYLSLAQAIQNSQDFIKLYGS